MQNGRSFKKTRLAPTPSGYLHLGNVLSFSITAAMAHQYGASILLRIDDLDRERITREYVQDIFDTLSFMNIPWHEGPQNYSEYENSFSQVHRLKLYNEVLQQLRDEESVFACTCSRARVLQQNGSNIYGGNCLKKHTAFDASGASWRLDTSSAGEIKVKTLEGSINTMLPDDMRYFIVRKKDGYPAYHLASVVDDVHFGIDLIVRGEDLWHSTIGQHYLSSLLEMPGFSDAVFHHHPLLLDGGGEKLSKSAGATSIQYLRKQGLAPADIYTLIGRQAGLTGEPKTWQELAGMLGYPA